MDRSYLVDLKYLNKASHTYAEPITNKPMQVAVQIEPSHDVSFNSGNLDYSNVIHVSLRRQLDKDLQRATPCDTIGECTLSWRHLICENDFTY